MRPDPYVDNMPMEKTFEDLRVDDVDAFADDVFDFIEAAGGFPTGIEPEQKLVPVTVTNI